MFFKFNLRYPTPALVLGLALLPLVPRSDVPEAALQAVLIGVLALVLLVTQLDPAVWPTGLRDSRFADSPGDGTALALAAAIGACSPGGRAAGAPRGCARGLARTVGPVALAAAGARAAGLRRPAPLPAATATRTGGRCRSSPAGRATWTDSRIAIVGLLHPVPARRARRVEPRGLRGAARRRTGPSPRSGSCAEWRRALNDGGYRYVVTTPFNYPGNVTPAPPGRSAGPAPTRRHAAAARQRRGVPVPPGRPTDPAACPALGPPRGARGQVPSDDGDPELGRGGGRAPGGRRGSSVAPGRPDPARASPCGCSHLGESLVGDEMYAYAEVHGRSLGGVIDARPRGWREQPAALLRARLGWRPSSATRPCTIRLPSLLLGTATVPLVVPGRRAHGGLARRRWWPRRCSR